MSVPLILAHSKRSDIFNLALKKDTKHKLNIAEFFYDTIQGEGASIGAPATFLRLKGCTLQCTWCDTTSVWKNGDFYTFEDVFFLLEQHNVINKLQQGQRLIITGGSPLKQQLAIIDFINAFIKKYNFKPFIEIENEVVLSISPSLMPFVEQWNNSPKLAHSGMKKNLRYKPMLIKQAAIIPNSWFKFVINDVSDWAEIEEDYLLPNIIERSQIILMPQADKRKTLQAISQKIINLAVQQQVIFSDRLHITVYDQKTGV